MTEFKLGKQQTEGFVLAKDWMYNDFVPYSIYMQIVKTDPNTTKKPWFTLAGSAGTGVSAQMIYNYCLGDTLW